MTQSNTLPGLAAFEFPSKATGRRYWIGIGLPAGYDASAQKSYPVVYLTDAEGSLHFAVEASRALALTGRLTEVIVVGIFNAHEGSRDVDFTPNPLDAPSMRRLADGHAGGGASKFYAFINNELIPTIDSQYLTDPEVRVFFGHSLGGLFGLFMMQQPENPFSHFLISSPSVWWNDREELRKPIALTDNKTVYISVGEFEQIPPNLDQQVLAQIPENILQLSNTTRMVEGALETYDYLSQHPHLEVFAHIEEAAPHISAGFPSYLRGIRVLLPGVSQSELRKRSSSRPELPW